MRERRGGGGSKGRGRGGEEKEREAHNHTNPPTHPLLITYVGMHTHTCTHTYTYYTQHTCKCTSAMGTMSRSTLSNTRSILSGLPVTAFSSGPKMLWNSSMVYVYVHAYVCTYVQYVRKEVRHVECRETGHKGWCNNSAIKW